jgi:hypothetical protein
MVHLLQIRGINGRGDSRGFGSLHITIDEKMTRLKCPRYRYAAIWERFGCVWPKVAVLLAAATILFIDSHFVILPDVYQMTVSQTCETCPRY